MAGYLEPVLWNDNRCRGYELDVLYVGWRRSGAQEVYKKPENVGIEMGCAANSAIFDVNGFYPEHRVFCGIVVQLDLSA